MLTSNLNWYCIILVKQRYNNYELLDQDFVSCLHYMAYIENALEEGDQAIS